MRISGEKMQHLHVVAERMCKVAEERPELNLNPDECYIIGLLHDIYGEEPQDVLKGVSGTALLKTLGKNFTSVITWSRSTPQDYLMKTLKKRPNKKLHLLWYIDMTTSEDGFMDKMPYDEKEKELREKYGVESKEYLRAVKTIKWLKENPL